MQLEKKADNLIKQELENRAGVDYTKSSKRDTSVLNAIENAQGSICC